MNNCGCMKTWNYKSDFQLDITPLLHGEKVGIPQGVPFEVALYGSLGVYRAYYDGENWKNCSLKDEYTISVYANDHHLGVGRLQVDVWFKYSDLNYPGGKDFHVVNKTDYALVMGNGTVEGELSVELALPYALVTAYDIARANGYDGTKEDFYKSLASVTSDTKAAEEATEAARLATALAVDAKDEAESAAEKAVEAAEKVKTLSEQVETAVTDASEATADAYNAALAATKAAEKAESAATNATTTATAAVEKAEAATEKAETAAKSATEAAESVNTALKSVEDATTDANTAAENAWNMASDANDAAATAVKSASTANAAASTASEAASEASTAAQNADSAASRADTAANAANSASEAAATAEAARVKAEAARAEEFAKIKSESTSVITDAAEAAGDAQSAANTAEKAADAANAAVENITDTLAAKEDVANKVTTLDSSSTDAQYPSAKAVASIDRWKNNHDLRDEKAGVDLVVSSPVQKSYTWSDYVECDIEKGEQYYLDWDFEDGAWYFYLYGTDESGTERLLWDFGTNGAWHQVHTAGYTTSKVRVRAMCKTADQAGTEFKINLKVVESYVLATAESDFTMTIDGLSVSFEKGKQKKVVCNTWPGRVGGFTHIDMSHYKTNVTNAYWLARPSVYLNISGVTFKGCTSFYQAFRSGMSRIDGLETLAQFPVLVGIQMLHTYGPITDLSQIACWDLSQCENMSQMFFGIPSSLPRIPVNSWNVSNVKIMSHTFASLSSTTAIECSSWDVSNVTDFTGCFSACKASFNISNWNPSSAVDMTSMFEGMDVASFTLPKNFLHSGVKKCDGMFRNWYYNFKSIDLTEADTSGAESIANILSGSGAFSGGNSMTLKLGPKFFACAGTTCNLGSAKNWTDYETIKLSLVTNLYDRVSAGLSTMTISLSANTKAKLTDEDKEYIASKGYTIA